MAWAFSFLKFSAEGLVQQRLLQPLQRGELALVKGFEKLGFVSVLCAVILFSGRVSCGLTIKRTALGGDQLSPRTIFERRYRLRIFRKWVHDRSL